MPEALNTQGVRERKWRKSKEREVKIGEGMTMIRGGTGQGVVACWLRVAERWSARGRRRGVEGFSDGGVDGVGDCLEEEMVEWWKELDVLAVEMVREVEE